MLRDERHDWVQEPQSTFSSGVESLFSRLLLSFWTFLVIKNPLCVLNKNVAKLVVPERAQRLSHLVEFSGFEICVDLRTRCVKAAQDPFLSKSHWLVICRCCRRRKVVAKTFEYKGDSLVYFVAESPLRLKHFDLESNIATTTRR